jgi:hypothetical protein
VAKVDSKAIIPDRHAPRLSKAALQPATPKTATVDLGKSALSIVFALSGAAWFSIGSGAVIAANPGTCQSMSKGAPRAKEAADEPERDSLPSSPCFSSSSAPPAFLRAQAPTLDLELHFEVMRAHILANIEFGNVSDGSYSNGKLGREVQPPPLNGDSELGTLRVREREVQPPPSNGDPELGTLRLRELELLPSNPKVQSPRSQPSAHLLAQVGYFQTNNIFSGVDLVDDALISSGLTLWAAPALGPKTNLVTVIDGNLIRYVEQSKFNYNQFRFRAGIRQQLTSRMYGEIGWNNQQLFRAGVGDRFLNENFIRLALHRRDRLSNKLRLDSFYEFRLSNANPDSRSRIVNSLAVSLSYYMQRNLQVGLDYQFALSDFTQHEREDQYHRLLGRLTYALERDSQINVQAGLTLGSSSDPDIDFDNFFFSVTYTVELGKF